MKAFLVVSDSHGNLDALEALCVQEAGHFDEVIFLGDHIEDAAYFRERTGLPVHAVKGNCDDSGPREQVLNCEGSRLLLTHGDAYGVKVGRLRISLRARELNVQAVLFGHTHVQEISEEDGVLYLNPGTIGAPRRGNGTFMLLSVDENTLSPHLGVLNP